MVGGKLPEKPCSVPAGSTMTLPVYWELLPVKTKVPCCTSATVTPTTDPVRVQVPLSDLVKVWKFLICPGRESLPAPFRKMELLPPPPSKLPVIVEPVKRRRTSLP